MTIERTSVVPGPLAGAWFAHTTLRAASRRRLFCFPFAGGSAATYREWGSALGDDVDVLPIELPGRGTRLAETPLTRWDEMIAALVPVLRPAVDRPFALFGHSLGARIAREVVLALRASAGVEPYVLYVSASRAPHVTSRSRPISQAPRTVFVDELRRMGGTPDAVLASDELIDLFLPALRADFALMETASMTVEPLACPIVAFCGVRDTIAPPEDVAAWRAHTRSAFHLERLDAGHYYLGDRRADVLAVLRDRVRCATIA
jgi:medium-chain acyl-[acyl-carrier-protein] hydrolase